MTRALTCAASIERLLTALAAHPDPPTAVRDPASARDLHVADSLAGLEAAELRRARRVADLGSGAGFPGLVLAIGLPCATVDLVEASARKCAVIETLRDAVGLTNARVVQARAEEWARDAGRDAYDAVTARALAALAVVVEYAAPLLMPGGALIAWKGGRDEVEERAGDLAAKELGLSAASVRQVTPFAGAHSRHLHVFTKVAETPDRFPRRPGMAAKRPLG